MDMTSLMVTDMQNSFRISVVDAVIGDIMTTESELHCTSDTVNNYKHMSDIEIIELDDPTVGLLLSSRYARHYFGECRKGNLDEPVAIHTDLGWAVLGQIDMEADINELRIVAICNNNELTIEKMISYMYRFDFMGRPTEEFPPEVKHASKFDEISWESMNNSVTYNESTGHHKVSMPWRYGREKTAETLETVDTLGYTGNRQKKLKEKVIKDETLMTGPDLLAKLVSIWFIFNRKKVFLSTDIENFFPQIEINRMDAPASWHLWWADAKNDKRNYPRTPCVRHGHGSKHPYCLVHYDLPYR